MEDTKVIEDTKAKSLAEQLEEHFKNTPPEVLEQEWFEISCESNGIDPKDPKAKQKLKMISLKSKLMNVLHWVGDFCTKTVILLLAIFASALIEENGCLYILLYLLDFILLTLYSERGKVWFWRKYRHTSGNFI